MQGAAHQQDRAPTMGASSRSRRDRSSKRWSRRWRRPTLWFRPRAGRAALQTSPHQARAMRSVRLDRESARAGEQHHHDNRERQATDDHEAMTSGTAGRLSCGSVTCSGGTSGSRAPHLAMPGGSTVPRGPLQRSQSLPSGSSMASNGSARTTSSPECVAITRYVSPSSRCTSSVFTVGLMNQRWPTPSRP